MNAPLPHLTSNTSVPAPSASFLERIDETMSGIDATVPVTSRSAYSFLSAGAISAVWTVMEHPHSATTRLKSASESDALYPGIDSSLSAVPPVRPRPRPVSDGTATPQLAARGWITRDSLSPTPPVECLSAVGRRISDQSRHSPESRIACVSASVSFADIPRQHTAIANAAI